MIKIKKGFPSLVGCQDSEPVSIGQDLWKQLRRVKTPVFSGDKRTYENWKAAFMACIDKSSETLEFELLQLSQCLSSEALKVKKPKKGWKRNMEEVHNFRPIRPGNHKDIKNFADLLDILKGADRLEELGDRSLSIKLQKKIVKSMLAQHH